MTQGVLIFAFNNNAIDYVKIAEWNACNIQRHLGLPVTLVTDCSVESAVFDQVILVTNHSVAQRAFVDQETVVEWRNSDRCTAFELSPYDTTILLDADYVVASDSLALLLNDSRDFICHQRAYEITQTFNNLNTFGQHKMSAAWATVVKFNRSSVAKTIFDIMHMVQHNYDHYANLYKFNRKPFRNDYALSIALTLVSGHRIDTTFDIAWPLINVNPDHEVQKIAQDKYEITYNKMISGEPRKYRLQVQNQDLHVMGKSYLENIIETH